MTWQPKWHERNIERLKQLAPYTRAAAFLWYQFCLDCQIDVYVTETLRTLARQKELLAEKKSQTLKSYHIVGQAFDFVPMVNGQPDYSLYKKEPFLSAVNYAKQLGFEWGGDWKGFVDSPHMQWNHKGYGTDSGDVPYKLPTLAPSLPAGIYYIATGGYAGPALRQVHDYLFKTGHGFNTKRGGDGSILFLIGPFDTSQPNFCQCEQFLRTNGHGYSLVSREDTANWKPKVEENPHVFIYTGGFSGAALFEVHEYLFKKGFGFDVTRAEDGALTFKIGPFDLSQPVFWECRGFFVLGHHEFTVK